MKTKIEGWTKICSFTYVQSMKSKAMQISMAVLCLIALLSMPLISFISGSDEEEKTQKTSIEKVFVYDNTDVISNEFINKNITSDVYGNIEYVVRTDEKDIEKLINRVDNENEIFLVINYNDNIMSLSSGISVSVYYSENSNITNEDANNYSRFVDENVKKAILKSANISEENIEKISKELSYEVIMYNEDGTVFEDDNSITQFEYMFSLTVIVILIFTVTFVGTKVSELIVTEKSTRVIEYIMTSIKPMAILVGKVIGSTLLMLTMIGSVIVSFIASVFLNGIIFASEDGTIAMPSFINDVIDNGVLDGITPLNIIIILVILVLGYLFYGLIGGIAGATVSKIEEMAEGIKIYTFTLMIGAYLPLFLMMTSMISGSGWGTMTMVVYLLPISSVFIIPQYIIFGKISIGIALGAIGILAVSIVLLLLFVNKVYEHMLYSNGATLKIKDVIGLAKESKGGANNGK